MKVIVSGMIYVLLMILLVSGNFVATLLSLWEPLSEPRRAFACEAIPPGPPLDELDKSASVFSGTVVEIQKGTLDGVSELHAVFLEVDRYWKSPNTNNDYVRLVVFTETSGDTCGYVFEKGSRYMVYVRTQEKDSSLHTGVGTRTRPIDDAQDDLAVLGEGREPTKQVGWEALVDRTTFRPIIVGEETTAMDFMIPIVVGVGTITAGAGILFIIRKQRSQKGNDKPKAV
jgi:hypothetical protein